MADIGSIINDRYVLEQVVGNGGMSTVYRARDMKLNVYYAIKEINKESRNELIAQTSLTEVKLLTGLNNSHLPRIIDVIDDGVHIFIIQEFVEGISLEKKLEEEKSFTQETVVEWMKQMCNVLYYLHSRNVIHRDIKPGNIMWAPSSESGGHITLIDFGIGRTYKKGKTKDTVMYLTEAFAAPEQKKQLSQSDARTDIYSLGLTMYTLLTGLYPDETYSIKPITQINSNLSTGLEKIILKCTAEDPNDRYQSTLELLYDLEHYKEGERIYLIRERKKLNIFLIFSSIFIFTLLVGIGFNISISVTKSKNYTTIVETAVTPEDCIEAISVKPGEISGYEKLWKFYNESDNCLSSSEISTMNSLLVKNESYFSDKDEYGKLNYDIGQDVWFNYGGTDEEIASQKVINDYTKSEKAHQFFENAIKSSSDNSDYVEDAEAYISWYNYIQDVNSSKKTGKLLTDEVLVEGWNSLYKLLEAIGNSEEPIIRLKMCSQVVSTIETNVYRYKSVGIDPNEISNALDTVNNIVYSINDNEIMDNDLVMSLKNDITGTGDSLGSLERARVALNDAFPEVKTSE